MTNFVNVDTKDPDDVKNYTFDWSEWLQAAETIASYTVTVPAGITLDSDANTSTTVRATLSGGTAGESYDINCEIVTTSTPAQTAQQTLTVPVAEL